MAPVRPATGGRASSSESHFDDESSVELASDPFWAELRELSHFGMTTTTTPDDTRMEPTTLVCWRRRHLWVNV